MRIKIALFCFVSVMCVTLATNPPHWNENISEMLLFGPYYYYLTVEASASLFTWGILQEEEACPKVHS